MATATKPMTPPSVEEVTERTRDAIERVQEVSRKATLTYLDSYERAVDSFTELQLKVANATKAPLVIGAAEAQAELTRELAAAGAGAARALLVD
jgi:hypothetical protein